jgi:hypothetical protein
MVNEFTGQAAFNVNLGGITAQNGLSFSLNMSYYGGGQDVFTKINPQFAPGSWVGAGFTLKPPSISVSGESVLLENQKYSLSLDGVSQQEMVQIGSSDDFVLKNNPYIRIHRTQGVHSTILKDRCPNQLNNLTTYNTPYIANWTVTLTDGTTYRFGGGTGNCDDSEYELCQPIVGNNYKYKPFYTLEQNAKSTVAFFLSRIMDRQAKSAIWFKYAKVMEDVIGGCNFINTTPTDTTSLDRAVYLQEIYSTNGPNSGDFKTSQIILHSVTRTEEPVYPPLLQNPMAFFENRKLESIRFLENGSLINTLSFNYLTSANRMVLDSVLAQAPQLSTTRKFLKLTYLPGTTRLTAMEDASGKILEYGYGTLETAPVTGTSAWFQTLGLPDPFPDDGIAFPYPNTRVTMARQIGNKFYLELENWSQGCNTGGDDGDTFQERLYEFENNGTYWSWKRTFTAPDKTCPTTVDFFIAPDGNYFIWSSYTAGVNSQVRVYDLTTDEENPAPVHSFDYTFTANVPAHTEIITYPNWFAVYNISHKKNVSFHYKNNAGNWTGVCPASIAPSTYAATNANPRTANYSGQDEGVSDCLTFSSELVFYPGPNFLVVKHTDPNVLHVFAYDGNGIQDYVKGLESTTPTLPNFTADEVTDAGLRAWARPWLRTTTNGVQYDNNWDSNDFDRIAVSDNLIVVKSGAAEDWKYLYVLGWDGKQLRYLYDEALYAGQDGVGGFDELDLAAGPDYFVLKNHFAGADSTRRGFFYYKVNLKAWTVSKSRLPVNEVPDINAEDWAMKAYPDYLFLEKMAERKGSMAFNTALTLDGENYTGDMYPTLHESRVFALDNTRTPIDVSNEFSRNSSEGIVNTGNLSSQGDHILGVDTYLASPPPPRTGGYQTWRRNTNVGAGDMFTRVPLKVSVSGAGQYYSARLVSGGTMVTTYNKTTADTSFTGIRFYPDAFDLVPSAADSSNLVQGSTVVTSLKIKTDGAASTGNQIQQITFSYPGVSPEGATTNIYKNFQSGVPNFKYVKKELAEGASVARFVRDEINAPLPLKDRSLIGTRTKSWLLPDKVSFKKPGGSIDSTLMQVVSLPDVSTKSFTVQNVRDSSRAYFHSAHRGSAVYSTNYDLKNGRPKITVSKVKVSPTVENFTVKLDVYHQDLVPTYTGPSFDMLRQTAVFQFPDDPCERDSTDPCSNLNLAWFTNARMQYILSSTIMTFDAAARVNAVYQWKPDFLGAGGYPPLDGTPANPVPPASGWTWKKVSSVLQRQDEVAVARCKSDLPIEVEQMGIFSTSFYGGADCNQLGSVTNSAKFSTALLNGEENIKSENCSGGFPCYGAFGRWVANGSVLQNQVVHSGENAIRVNALYGPSINLKIREKAGFMDRKKGFVVSGWMLAKPNSDPAFRVEFRQNVSPPVPGTGADPVVYSLDLIQEYITAKGAFPVDKWVKLERLIPYEELSSKGVFGAPTSHDYLRIWPGKGTATTTEAVYVDDVRLYPADAQVMTRNFDGTGILSSALNADNEPTFFEYDVWRAPVGARKKDGLIHSSTAVKLIHE